MIKGRTQKYFLNLGQSPANTLRRSAQRKRVTLHPYADFKAKKFPFILSTNVFQEFLSDLESTVGNTLDLRDFNFSYRYPALTLPATHK